MISKRAAFGVSAALVGSAPAHAAVTISTAATQNMNCAGGVCAPTASDAVLNVSDLENYLSQFGNVRVMTTGSGVEANNIVVGAAFASPDSSSLTLDAHKAITINAAVSIGSGTAELEVQSDTGGTLGTLLFGQKGHITFGSLSDIFGINGGIFTLVGSVKGLASAVAANPSGAFALANSYDAGQDGTYTSSPVPTTLSGSGVFDGLGNTVSNLSITTESGKLGCGLFTLIYGSVRNFRVSNAVYQFIKTCGSTGGLVDTNYGTLSNDFVAGSLVLKAGGMVGGLVGMNWGNISFSSTQMPISRTGTRTIEGPIGGVAGENAGNLTGSYATGDVIGTRAGGLVGYNNGSITMSYATGNAQGLSSTIYTAYVGGLVSANYGTIQDSYALGAVSSPNYAGGFVGLSSGKIKESYSIGQVTGDAGGFDGTWDMGAKFSYCYWDTTTSGTDNGTAGGNLTGITGLSTQQLQSGLPEGFRPKFWTENSGINNGLPYLIANPPPK